MSDDLKRTLSQGNAQVVFFTLVVDYMSSPEKIYLMTHSMGPVIGKINKENKTCPVPPRRIVGFEEMELFKQELIDTDPEDFEKQSRKLRSNAATDVGDRIWQPVQLLVRKPLHQQFNPDQNEKDRNG